MQTIHYGIFNALDLCCPICRTGLVPPEYDRCEHIALYWVHGPADEPFFEFVLPEYGVLAEDLLDSEKLQTLAEDLRLQIQVLDEQGADYPTQIILGIKQDSL